MSKVVLITGGSSGIGKSIGEFLHQKGFVVYGTSRNPEKITNSIFPLVALDVRDKQSIVNCVAEVIQKSGRLDIVINNAGVGNYGNFIETSLQEELNMIELNISSLVILTKLFSQDMVKRGSGSIMNVASLLSFLPFPYYSVYSASKSFVLAFSETVNAELEGTGVMVKALCPGPIDTGFTTNEMTTTNAYKTNKPVLPEIVAKEGVKLLLNKKTKKIVGFTNWFISNLPRITPDFIMIKIKKNLASQIK